MSLANKYLKSDSWKIGIINNPGHDIIKGIQTTPCILTSKLRARSSFLADPFGFYFADELFVLCEHYHFSKGIANIVCCKVIDNQHLSEPVVILDTGSHLSFPYVFHQNQEIYFCPESSADKTLSIYKLDGSPYSWKHFHTIDNSLSAIDPVIFHRNNLWWCLYSTTEHGSHSSLHAKYAKKLTGPWHQHEKDPVLKRNNLARNGGTPIIHENCLYRVAQNSTKTYGGGLKLYRIDEITTSKYSESDAGDLNIRLDAPYNEGFHTLSIPHGSEIAFVDTKRRILSSRAAINSIKRAKRKIPFLP